MLRNCNYIFHFLQDEVFVSKGPTTSNSFVATLYMNEPIKKSSTKFSKRIPLSIKYYFMDLSAFQLFILKAKNVILWENEGYWISFVPGILEILPAHDFIGTEAFQKVLWSGIYSEYYITSEGTSNPCSVLPIFKLIIFARRSGKNKSNRYLILPIEIPNGKLLPENCLIVLKVFLQKVFTSQLIFDA